MNWYHYIKHAHCYSVTKQNLMETFLFLYSQHLASLAVMLVSLMQLTLERSCLSREYSITTRLSVWECYIHSASPPSQTLSPDLVRQAGWSYCITLHTDYLLKPWGDEQIYRLTGR